MAGTMLRQSLLIWLTCMITYGYFSTVINDNIQTRVALTLSLVQHHTVDINEQADFTTDKAYFDGNYYSDKAPGLSLLAVPPALVLSGALDPSGTGAGWVRAGGLSQSYGLLVYLLTLSTVGLLASLAVAATYCWNIKHGVSQKGALLAATALGFATPFFGWASLFIGHAASGSLLLLGFFGLWRASRTAVKPRTPLLAFGSGCALGAAFLVEFPAGPAVAIIGIACACGSAATPGRWVRIRLVFTPAAMGLILAIAPLPIYNELAFHSPFNLGYANVQGFPGMRQGFLGVSLPDARIAWALIGGDYRGLLPLSPVLILFPIAAFVSIRHHALRLPAIVAVLIFVYYVSMNAGYYYWDGGSSTGPRHLIPALPFMTLLLGKLWDVSNPALRAAFFCLLGVSLVISLVCASVDVMAPPNYAHPLSEYLLPAFLEGRLHRIVAARLLPGTNDLWLLTPLLALWGFAAWLLCRRQDSTA